MDMVVRVHYETRLAALEEMRELTRERVVKYQEAQELKTMALYYTMLSVVNLVLRRYLFHSG